jgi:hypothetical protein
LTLLLFLIAIEVLSILFGNVIKISDKMKTHIAETTNPRYHAPTYFKHN